MTFIYLFYQSKIICLSTVSEFLSFTHMTSKLSILSNHIEHSKELVLCYTLLFFTILKSLYLTGQLAHLKDNSNLRKKLFCIKKSDLQGFYQLLIL